MSGMAQFDGFVQMDRTGFYLDGAPYYARNVNMEVTLYKIRDAANPQNTSISNVPSGYTALWLPSTRLSYCDDFNGNTAESCFPLTYSGYEAYLDGVFQDLKAEGFNSIRLTNLGSVRYDATADKLVYPWFAPWLGGNYQVSLGDPSADPSNHLNKVINYYDIVQALGLFLDKCEEHEIKAIVVLASSGVWMPNARGKFFDYMEKIAGPFKDHPAVMAWDLHNEPSLEFQNALPAEQTKEFAVSYVQTAYNKLKAIDPNHLITIGVGDYGLDWFDPGMMESDFISFHLYSKGYGTLFQSDLDGVRTRRFLKWCQPNFDRPWMIGETSFPGADPAGVPPCDNLPQAECEAVGTGLEQENLGRLVFEDCRDCGGAGISWWKYSDDLYDPNNASWEDYMGLFLPYSRSAGSRTAKGIAAVLGTTSAVPDAAQCGVGVDMVNPYGFTKHLLRGALKDGNGQFIENGFVGLDYVLNGKYLTFWTATTEEQGGFNFQMYVPDDVPREYSYNFRVRIMGGGFLTSNTHTVVYPGSHPNNPTTLGELPIPLVAERLEETPPELIVDNNTTQVGQNAVLRSRHWLSASNYTVNPGQEKSLFSDGYVELTPGSGVVDIAAVVGGNTGGGDGLFQAGIRGVPIFLPGEFDEQNISFRTASQAADPTATGPSAGEASPEMELARLQLALFPNPATHFVTVRFDDQIAPMERYQITSMMGEVVVRGKGLVPGERIDLSNLARGVYTFEATFGGAKVVRKLALQ